MSPSQEQWYGFSRSGLSRELTPARQRCRPPSSRDFPQRTPAAPSAPRPAAIRARNHIRMTNCPGVALPRPGHGPTVEVILWRKVYSTNLQDRRLDRNHLEADRVVASEQLACGICVHPEEHVRVEALPEVLDVDPVLFERGYPLIDMVRHVDGVRRTG